MKAVPFLFSAMSETAVLALVMRYYDLHRQHFNDSRETHHAEATAHLRNVAARYSQKLTRSERRFYEASQNESRRAAFRICRDLSMRTSIRADCDNGEFFLAYGDLGARLLMDPKGARKLMPSLVKVGVVEIVRKGERWEKGRRARATVWRYSL